MCQRIETSKMDWFLEQNKIVEFCEKNEEETGFDSKDILEIHIAPRVTRNWKGRGERKKPGRLIWRTEDNSVRESGCLEINRRRSELSGH